MLVVLFNSMLCYVNKYWKTVKALNTHYNWLCLVNFPFYLFIFFISVCLFSSLIKTPIVGFILFDLLVSSKVHCHLQREADNNHDETDIIIVTVIFPYFGVEAIQFNDKTCDIQSCGISQTFFKY